jgi:hypothetical protein
MSAKFSTGLRNHMLGTGSFKNAMDGCTLNIYGGTVPATADAALGGATLLCVISNDATATGLTFGTPSGGIISKTISEVWRGVNAASGTATFFRLEESADDGSASTTFKRAQGTVAVVGGQLNISNAALVSGESQPVNNFNLSLPTL